MRASTLAALREARRQKRAVVLATWLSTGEQRLLAAAATAPASPATSQPASSTGQLSSPTGQLSSSTGQLSSSTGQLSSPTGQLSTPASTATGQLDDDALAAAAAAALRTDRAEVLLTAAGEVLLEPHNPPLRLILVGAVHIAHPLTAMAKLAGFDVTVVDPRRAFATAARFPEQTLVTLWPDLALRALAPDTRTAVVTLTHDPKLDDPALREALQTPAFYLGCLGSKKTHASRLTRLAAAGWDPSALARLHGPVGLAIGARAPAEIALSILAQIIATLRGEPPAEPSGEPSGELRGKP